MTTAGAYDRRIQSVHRAEQRFKRAAKLLVMLAALLMVVNWLLTEKIDAARRECKVDRRDAETKLAGICSDERRGGLRSPAECEYHKDVARRKPWQCILAKIVNNALECPMGACNCFGVNCTLVFFSFVLLVVAVISVATCCLCGMSVASFAFASLGRNQLPWRHAASQSFDHPHYTTSAPPHINGASSFLHQHPYAAVAAAADDYHQYHHNPYYSPVPASLVQRHHPQSPGTTSTPAQPALEHRAFTNIKIEHVD